MLNKNAEVLKNEARVASISQDDINKDIIKNGLKRQDRINRHLDNAQGQVQARRAAAEQKARAAKIRDSSATKIQSAYRRHLARQNNTNTETLEQPAVAKTSRKRVRNCSKHKYSAQDGNFRHRTSNAACEDGEYLFPVVVGKSVKDLAFDKISEAVAQKGLEYKDRIVRRIGEGMEAQKAGIEAQKFEKEAEETAKLAQYSDVKEASRNILQRHGNGDRIEPVFDKKAQREQVLERKLKKVAEQLEKRRKA